MNVPSHLRRLLADKIGKKGSAHRGRLRLLGLLFLFDALLIATVLLSLQGVELVEEEVTVRQTREVYDYYYREQVITNTEVITEVVPYGSTE